MGRTFKLGPADPPSLEAPTMLPEIPRAVYEARIVAARERMAARGFDALLVYGDREHVGCIAYISGYDPRFEEGLVVLLPEGDPVLIVGNEGVGYAPISPLSLDVRLCQTFSLIDQDRSRNTKIGELLASCGLNAGMTVGLAGWKTFGPEDSDRPATESEVPSFIVDAVRGIAGGADRVVNATGLFMDAADGLRSRCEPDQIAAFEFAATHASQGILRALRALRPGLSEFEVAQRFGWIGQPLSYHPVVLSGPRTRFGLASASGRRIEPGDPLFMGMGGWGANSVRAGYIAAGPGDLPAGDSDWVEAVLMPYYSAVVTWYEALAVGARAGDVFDAVQDEVAGGIDRWMLNPGHLTHIDEWVSSPFAAGSDIRLASGMALQMDIIPVTKGGHFSANAEDGVVLADAALRGEIAAAHPAVWRRMQARRAFAIDTLGIALSEDVLPTSDILGWVPPYLLETTQVLLPA